MPPADRVREALEQSLALGVFQRIENVTVIPRPESALVLFSTTQPCVPIVEVLQQRVPVTSVQKEELLDVRFPIFAPLTTEHAFVVGSPYKPLPQGAHLLLRITAPPSQYRKVNPKSAVYRGAFDTLRRSAVVRIEKLHVRVDGDPLDAGELYWSFALYDAIRRVQAGAPAFHTDRNAYDSKDIDVDIRFPVPVAPDQLTLYSKCIDDDTFRLGVRAVGYAPPAVPPEAAGRGENDWGEWTELLFTFALPDVPGNHRLEREIESIWGGVSFSLRMVVETKVESRFEGAIGGVKTKSVAPSTTAGLGEAAEAGGPGNGRMLAPGPDALFYRRMDLDARNGRHAWRPIAPLWSPQITTATGDDGQIHVYTLDDKGAVRRLRWRAERDPLPDGEWENLGGRMRGAIAAVPGRDGAADLFARGSDGAVYHRAVAANDRRARRWEPLGEAVPDAKLMAIAAGPRRLHLILADEQGNVLHKYREGGRWRPGQERWDDLGGSFSGPVVATAGDDGTLALVATAEGGRAFWKEWGDGRWRPDGREWDGGATIDEALPAAPAPALPEVRPRPRRAAAQMPRPRTRTTRQPSGSS